MKYFLFVLLCTSLVSCKEKQPDPISLTDRQFALHGIGNAVIIRSFLDLQNSVNALSEFANSYVRDSASVSKLLFLRREWTNTVISWKLSSIFLQGKLDAGIRSPKLYAPANAAAIENIILSNTPQFDLGYMQNLEETTTGLAAIEYLIFGVDQGNTAPVLSAFATTGSRRGAYLRALCMDLKLRSDQLLYRWSLAGDAYINRFMASYGAERSSSIGVLADNMISTLSKIKDERIGMPLGANGAARPELVESKYGGASVAFIRAELQSIHQVFTGFRTINIGVKAFNWLLDQSNARSGDVKLSAAIGAQFADIYSKLDAIKIPLEQAVVTHPTQIAEIQESISKLQILIEQDMVAGLHFRN